MPVSPRARQRIRRGFYPEDFQRALAILTRWDVDACIPGESHSRMHSAALNIARGDYGRLKKAIGMARIDYRDVLLWGDDPTTKNSRFIYLKPPDEPLHPEEDAFLAGIRRKPADNGIRLVYADWLDEHGHGQRAEYLRVLCGWIACHPENKKELIERERKLRKGLLRWWLARIRGMKVRDRKRTELRVTRRPRP